MNLHREKKHVLPGVQLLFFFYIYHQSAQKFTCNFQVNYLEENSSRAVNIFLENEHLR